MITMRILDAPAFRAVGKKTWISGQDNAAFAEFWRAARESGLIGALSHLAGGRPGAVTGSTVFGVSRVEKDPANRAFDFFIAAEAEGAGGDSSLESFEVPAARWAIFENSGPMPGALVDAELYAFFTWLPTSGYEHAHAPEMEVYPARGDGAVEFWLPISKASPAQ